MTKEDKDIIRGIAIGMTIALIGAVALHIGGEPQTFINDITTEYHLT